MALGRGSVGLSGGHAVHPRRPRGRQPGRQLGRAAGLCLPDPAKCNDIILNELARGVTSLHLRFDRAARAGLDADQPGADALAGVDGVMIYSVDDLDRLLTGVYLDLVTVSLDAGAQAVAAAMLEGLWHRRRLGPDAAKGAFNADPLGALAATGTLPVAIDAALAQMADLARHAAATYRHVTAVGVDTSPYHDAGATGEPGPRRLDGDRGRLPEGDDAAASTSITGVPADPLLFGSLRSVPRHQQAAGAARKMWARVTEACGATEPARAMKLNAVTAWRMMSKRDPWVNMLRTTVACFAAGVGGADSITIRPFDATSACRKNSAGGWRATLT